MIILCISPFYSWPSSQTGRVSGSCWHSCPRRHAWQLAQEPDAVGPSRNSPSRVSHPTIHLLRAKPGGGGSAFYWTGDKGLISALTSCLLFIVWFGVGWARVAHGVAPSRHGLHLINAREAIAPAFEFNYCGQRTAQDAYRGADYTQEGGSPLENRHCSIELFTEYGVLVCCRECIRGSGRAFCEFISDVPFLKRIEGIYHGAINGSGVFERNVQERRWRRRFER